MRNLLSVKKKEKTQSIFETLTQHQSEVYIKIDRNKDLLKQIEMINLTTKDLTIIRALQPVIKEHLDHIVEQFYKNLGKEQSLMRIINDHSHVDRLKKTLHKHIYEMFSGQIDDSFIQQRNIIAHVHVRIGLDPKWYMCAFQDLLQSLVQIVSEQVNDIEENSEVIMAITKILNLEQQIVLEAYELENERIRNEAAIQKKEMEIQVSTSAQELAAISEETSSSLQEMTAKTNGINDLTEASSQIAISTEEKSKDGKSRLEYLVKVITETEDNMKTIANEMNDLMTASKKIEEISRMVTSIADQTNLLALNAAIEAARAGEQGKGFAVVANEVRKLAEDTKNAVSGVSVLVSEINQYTSNMSKSITKNTEQINKGTTESNMTSEFFEEIVQSMVHMKKQNLLIADEMQQLTTIFKDINGAAEQVAVASDKLTNITNSL
ncbi:MAG: globin-coupled sensor protein [Bacillaceae bacterium]|nr:globin-coupled sensor protein [Bacillaceae bacterium]